MASNRYNGNVVPFADNATGSNRTVFGDMNLSDNIDDNLNDDYKLGWEIVGINDSPTKQDFNALGFTQGKLISHLYQQGISEYNAAQEYYVNSLVMGSNGVVYQSLSGTEGSPNVGDNPITDDVNWKLQSGTGAYVIDTVDDLGTVPSGIDTAIVKDLNRGGTFIYDATQSAVNNGGTVFDGWVRQYSGAVSVKWFGAVGDGVADDTVKLNYVSTYCTKYGEDMFMPKGDYIVSDSFTPPSEVWCYGVGQNTVIKTTILMEQIPNKSIVICDSIGQPTYKLRDFAITGRGNKSGDNLLNGLQVGSSRNSIFNKITITCCWNKGLLVKSDKQGQDIENPVFNQVYTAFCGGVLLHANNLVTRGNITDGGFYDCNFVTDIGTTYTIPRCPIEFLGDTGRVIFGITISRCFAQPRNAPTLKMKGTIYNCKIEDIYADVWGASSTIYDGTTISNSIYGVELEGIFNNEISTVTISPHSAGWKVKGCNNNKFSGIEYRSSRGISNGSVLDIDSSSYQNQFDGIFLDRGNYLELADGSFAASSNIIFGDSDFISGDKVLIKDLGYGNEITGSVFKNMLKLQNSPSLLFAVTGTNLTNYPLFTNSNGVTVALASGKLQVTFPTVNTTPPFLNIPIPKTKNYASVRMRYKFITTGFTGTVSCMLYGFAKNLIADGEYHECTFIVDSVYNNYPYYGLMQTEFSVPVTLEIEKWEVYDGYNLPYIPNYVAL